MAVHFGNGAAVSPQVDANFNCLQISGDFCQEQPPTEQQLEQELLNVKILLRAVKAQSAGLTADQMTKVQPWIEQLTLQKKQLERQLGEDDAS